MEGGGGGTGGRKGRVLSEDTISSRNVLRFYWEKMGVAERERERERERLAAPARPPALPRALLRALISSIISFGDAADRWWVRENERESISGNQPPGLRPAARRGVRERKYQGTLRSNNPLRPNRPSLHLRHCVLPISPCPSPTPSPAVFSAVCRKKIKNLDRRGRDMRGKSISDWRRFAWHRRICVTRERNREAELAGYDASDNVARCFAAAFSPTVRCYRRVT